jgi:hypothetical protein
MYEEFHLIILFRENGQNLRITVSFDGILPIVLF